jgi:hypothetical protein
MNQKTTTSMLASLACSAAILLSACGPTSTPAPTADINAIYTQAAATIMVGLTQTSAAMPSATPTVTPTSTASPSPTLPPIQELMTATQPVPVIPTSQLPASPTVDPATARGCYNATFLADVTILYTPNFKPGDKFTKTWRVKNTGSCDWPRSFKIAFASGDNFGADTTTLSQKVLAGEVTEISLAMKAPALTGVVNSNWQITTDIGKPFGPVLSVAITLPGAAAVTPSSGGCLNSALTSETIPSGTIFNSGETFTKTWVIQNTGTCGWNGSFKIYFIGGDLLGSDTTKIRQIVGPGINATIFLDMTAPATAGTVTSSWQMMSDTGKLFGQVFVISIVVK